MRTRVHGPGISVALVSAVWAFSAGTAAAERSVRPCTITIPRAPDDVRATVEAWVEREPSCRVSLEVRIVPSDGGLYVLARDERGRTYDRIVPDAQSAGVLVASWMADDTMPSAPRWPSTRAVAAPMDASPAETPALVETVTRTDRAPSRWLAVEGLLGVSDGGGSVSGLRAELDLVNVGSWALGASGAMSHGGVELTSVGLTSTELGTVEDTTDVKVLAYAVRRIDLGQWHVRPAIGFGALASTVYVVERNYPSPIMNQRLSRVSPMGELSFLVAREVGASWALQGGLVLDLDPQDLAVHTTDVDGIARVHRSLDLVLMFGVGRRL